VGQTVATRFLSTISVVICVVCSSLSAQDRLPAGAADSPKTPKAQAPIDLTGYWVSIVSEDWRWRMVTPGKGDYASVPINAEAKKIADAWDPTKDERAGEQCKAYGAPSLMRLPGRFHIAWRDETTLAVEADAGSQTRLFHFTALKSANPPRTLQGDSVASWLTPRVARDAPPGDGQPAKSGTLKVITSRLRPGYLRKNGIPYSERTVMTEYWDLFREGSERNYLVVTTMVDDPIYLQNPWITSLNFKKELDGSKWAPSPCAAR
jgi:hypothetical protein